MRWLALLTLACGCGGTSSNGVFIALQHDFAPFRSWRRVVLGESQASAHLGPIAGYVRNPPSDGRYPVGSIVVKTIESAGPLSNWETFAMAKRGGGYNADGALDWEYFVLQLTDDGVPVIVSRGVNPDDSGGGGHGYPAVDGNTCNRCHGADGTDATDHILSPLLQP